MDAQPYVRVADIEIDPAQCDAFQAALLARVTTVALCGGPHNPPCYNPLSPAFVPRLSCDFLHGRILRISSSLDTRYPYVWPLKMGHN